MRDRGARLFLSVIAVLVFAGTDNPTAAPEPNIPQIKAPYSPVPGALRYAGLWDKPNEACMVKCQTHVRKGCFKRLSDKDPAGDPSSIQDRCEDKFSLCLYDCMCDTCDENQIIIRP